jgi:hypothetical protein
MFKLEEVKKGDSFYEADYGENLLHIALEDARRVEDPDQGKFGWEVKTELHDPADEQPSECLVYLHDKAGGYGPKLSKFPMYI